MPMDFAKAPGGGDTYPKRSFDGQEDQSYGFNPAFKLQTGNMRGIQGVGYGGVEIDGAHNRIKLNANNTQLSIGDTSDENDLTGMALTDPSSNKTLVSFGSDSSKSTSGLSVFDSTGLMRLLGGSYPDGSVKIKLSQPGFDVSTATDNQLIWSSDFNSFKIVSSGIATFPTINVSTGGGGGWAGDILTTEIFHNLGYVPIALVFINFGSSYQLTPSTRITTSGTGVNISTFEGSTDSTRLLLTTSGLINRTGADSSSFGGWAVKYYLLRETAATA